MHKSSLHLVMDQELNEVPRFPPPVLLDLSHLIHYFIHCDILIKDFRKIETNKVVCIYSQKIIHADMI